MARFIRKKNSNKLASFFLLSFYFYLAAIIGIISAIALIIVVIVDPFDIRTGARQINHENTILLRFNTPVSQRAIEALYASEAVNQVDAIPALGIRIVHVPPEKDIEKVVERYAKNPLVEFAEINELVDPDVIPNDEYYSSQWHHEKINSPSAWSFAKAENVLVAICDTGISPTHPDLEPIIRADLGWNVVDESDNWHPVTDHGTHTAGAAVAATNNTIGVAGVGWGAQIIPIRISNHTSGAATVSNAAKCIQHAADIGARVINLSYRMAAYESIEAASAYALSKNAIVTVAAGNDGRHEDWPHFPSFIAVGGTNSNDEKASWSNYGDFIDMVAPGSSIWTTRADGAYGSLSGTSMSTPLVAGVIALVAGANPSLNGEQILDIVLSTADDIGDKKYFGNGRVNAGKAIEAALNEGGIVLPTPTPYPTMEPTFTPTPTIEQVSAPVVNIESPLSEEQVRGNVIIISSASSSLEIERMEIYINGEIVAFSQAPHIETRWNVNPRHVPSGSHTIMVRAYDALGNIGQSSITVTK